METNKSNRISLCMIVRNEEKRLGKCLASVINLVHEIIVVDTGSRDRTKDIAGRFGGRIFDFAWADDFAAARNSGLRQASGDWILVLDADEYLEEATGAKIMELTTRHDAADMYLLPVRNLIAPGLGEWQTSLALRLFRNSPDLRFRGKIHEQVIVPADKRVEIAEKGPWIIHPGYVDSRRAEKSRRNMDMLKKALASEPRQPYYHYYISTEYIIQGDFKNALDHVRQALAGIPADVLLFRVAAVRNAVLCLTELGGLDEAEEMLQSEIAIHDRFPDYYYYLGNVYREKGEYARAIANFNKALAIKAPSLAGCSVSGSAGFKSLFHRGLCQEKLRRYFEAVESFRAAMRENPSFDVPLANLIKCLLFVGKETGCLHFLATHFNIVSPQLQLTVARLLFAGGYPEAARSYIRQTADAQTGFAKSVLLGEITLAGGNPKEALAYFEKIPAGNPFYASSLVFRCLCAWKRETPAEHRLIRELAGAGPNQPAAKLLKLLNPVFYGQAVAFIPVKNQKSMAACLNFGQELFTKLLECKMFGQAENLGAWLLDAKPELRWELVYCCRKSGGFNLADSFRGCGDIICDEPYVFLETAKVYEKISNDFLDLVPVLPESPLSDSGN